MGKINKNTLGYLGANFQYKLVNAFVVSPNYFKDLYPIIDQNMFTESRLNIVVGVMKEYFAKHETTASYDILDIMLREKCRSEDDAQFFHELIERLKKETTEGIDEIEDMAEKFFKQQNLVRVSNQILRIATDGDFSRYDECQTLVENALSVGRHSDRPTSPMDSIDNDLSKENVVTIPTGIEMLDDILGGGLDKGKIGLIMAASAIGKTSFTTGIAANAATYRCAKNNNRGYKVLQLVFEDSPRDIHRKYFGKISQVEVKDMNKDESTTKKVRDLIYGDKDFDLYKNNIRIEQLDTGEVTASDIKAKIIRYINEGFKPDVVIIDYFECIKAEPGTGNLKKWEQEEKTMRKFENYAKKLDVAMWIPTQGNRESMSSELVTMGQGSGSISKQQIAQVVISITKSLEDQKNDRATITVLKQRGGAAGIQLPNVNFNNGTCTFVCDDVVDFTNAVTFSNGGPSQFDGI